MTDLGSVTALSVVDPHNDFISEGGKIWERIKGFAETNNCVPHTDEQEKRLSDGGDSRQRSSRCQLPRAHHTERGARVLNRRCSTERLPASCRIPFGDRLIEAWRIDQP
jgi:hypothetical protein